MPISDSNGFPAGVDAYRRSVQEADLARDIDRELISYRSLARYFVVTGKEEDGKAALAAEAGLKDAIIASMKGTTNPARLEQVVEAGARIPRLHQDFRRHLKVKEESARITQNQLMRSGNSLRYKLDDLPSNADDDEMPVITLGAKKVTEQFQAVDRARQHIRGQFRQGGRRQRAGAAEIRRELAEGDLVDQPTRSWTAIKEVSGMLEEYRRRSPS